MKKSKNTLLAHPCRVLAVAMGVASLVGASMGMTAGADVRAATATPPSFGINVQLYDFYSTSTLKTDANQMMFYVKALGANSVAITIPFQLTSITGNTIKKARWTPSPSAVGDVVKLAEKYKLKVMLRPIVDDANLAPKWRGEFDPSDPKVWFQNYLTFLHPYLQVAQTDKVWSFDLATELQSTFGFSGWSSAISLAKAVYKGNITISGVWAPSTRAYGGTTVGIDAYKPVTAKSSASVSTLLSDWNANLKSSPFPSSSVKPIITELGIVAQDGAYQSPSSYGFGKNVKINGQIQANWFAAACDFVHQHKLGGLFFWRLDIGTSPTTSPSPASPEWFSSAAVKEIKSCFKSLG